MTDTTLVERLRRKAEDVKPRIVMGDDDSIYLTEWQEGYKKGLLEAAQLAEENGQANTIEKLAEALEGIRAFGFRHPGHGYSCAKLATAALALVRKETGNEG